MLEGNYTIKWSNFPELIEATMDVDGSGDHGEFTFPDTHPVKMNFSDPQHFDVDGPGGIWRFDVTRNVIVVDGIDADGDVRRPDGPGPDDDGVFTSTATGGAVEAVDSAAKAATQAGH